MKGNDCQTLDAAFWWQLILSFADTDLSQYHGWDGNKRRPFYSKVTQWSVIYMATKYKIANTYGHSVKIPTIDELVEFDGIII